MDKGTWYQCQKCKVVCSSGAAMYKHEKKHSLKSTSQSNNDNGSLRGVSSMWCLLKVDTDIEDDVEILDLDQQHEDFDATHGHGPDISDDAVDKYVEVPDNNNIPSPKPWAPHKLLPIKSTPTSRRRPKSHNKINKVSAAVVQPIAPNMSSKTKNIKKNPTKADFMITEQCQIVVNYNSAHPKPTSTGKKTCSICGFIGRNVTDLLDHNRTHTKEKPFQCPACPKVFSRTQNMRHHIRFNCDEARRQGLAAKFQQRARENVQKSRLPHEQMNLSFKCPKCVEKFASSLKLSYHLRVHSVGIDGVVFNCAFCKGAFYSARSVTDHEARMHNKLLKNGYECKHCKKNLSTKSSLKRHIYLNHCPDGDATTNSDNNSLSVGNDNHSNQVTACSSNSKKLSTRQQYPYKTKDDKSWTWPKVTRQESLPNVDQACKVKVEDVMGKVDQDKGFYNMYDEGLEEPEFEMPQGDSLLGQDPLAF